MTSQRVTDRTTVVVVESDVYAGVLDADFVLFSTHDRRLHVLNPTAHAIWSRLGVGRTVHGLIGELADDFGVPADEIANDVEALVDHLVRAGLCADVTRSPRTAPVDRRGPAALRMPPDPTDRLVPFGASVVGPLEALGVPVTVETDDSFLRVELARVLDPLVVSAASIGRQRRSDHQHLSITSLDGHWVIRRNDVKVATVGTRSAAIRTVVAECNSAPLPHVTDAVVFHAAGIDFGRGVVLFPGVSNAGKSTLAAQLLCRGHGYLSDEAIAVDLDSLRARTFPKSLALESSALDALAGSGFPKPGPSTPSTAVDIDPRLLGPGRLSRGGAISAVVFPRFDPATASALVPLDPVDALRNLLANAFDFDHVGQPAFDALVRLAGALPCYSLTHAGGSTHLDQLAVMFGESPAVSL